MGKVTAWRPWIRGLLTSVITGIAHGAIGALTAAGIQPDQFNLTMGLHSLLKMFFVTGIASGLISLFLFLQKSPIPDEVEVQTTIGPLPPIITGEMQRNSQQILQDKGDSK